MSDHSSGAVIGPNPARERARRALRVGIVGCGRVTEECHLPALRALGGHVNVVAVADPDAHRRRRVAGMFDVPNAFADLDSMLRGAGEIDAVAVCTPAPLHAEAVVAALRAGKHVLVEKPLALTLDDADRMTAAAAESFPRLKVMIGFNLRHHRLVRKAREMIARGALGEVTLVRTLWTSAIRLRATLPPWRNRRHLGGGVLSELAVHHVDLVRHLAGADVEDVYAQTHHGEGDDEAAALTTRLTGGATASCAFSERAADANEVEVFGSKGRLAFSLYRFDSFTFTPTGRYGSGPRQIIETITDVPEVWPILRRGGDFKETYRRQWLSFIDAIERDEPVAATVEDGRAALQVILAAGASASAGRRIAVAEGPRKPERVRADEPARAAQPDADGERPHLSAIIATDGSFASIRRTVRHLLAQTVCDRIELVIVCADESALDFDERELDGLWGHRVVEVGPFRSAARVNAAGVRAASAPIVALCEDHSFPDAGWAEALLVAHGGPYAAVGPAVRNANPATRVSRADCLIGYGPWLEPIRPCEPAHLPGHNSSYKRDVLLSYGDRLDDLMEAETVLQWDLRAKGHRLYLDPAARTAHTNFARLGVWTRVQFHAGRMFAATRAARWPLWKRALFTCASPLIPLVRLRRSWGHARRASTAREPLLPGVLPALLWGLALDGLGQMAGYATGAGASRNRMAGYEYERVRFITGQDRAALAATEPATSRPQFQKAS